MSLEIFQLLINEIVLAQYFVKGHTFWENTPIKTGVRVVYERFSVKAILMLCERANIVI